MIYSWLILLGFPINFVETSTPNTCNKNSRLHTNDIAILKFLLCHTLNMGDWMLYCDCCHKQIKKIRNPDGVFESFNLDDTFHEKHYKIWASSVASFAQYDSLLAPLDPTAKISDLTIEAFDNMLDMKINLKFGKYYHGQSGLKEIWLTPKKFIHHGINYYVSGNVDGIESETLIELKTTWVTSKTKMQPVIEKAQTQANIYAWIGGFKEAKIIIKNLAKSELDQTIQYIPDTSNIESLLVTYIDKNKERINKY